MRLVQVAEHALDSGPREVSARRRVDDADPASADIVRNAVVLFDRDGKLVGQYYKVHLYDAERRPELYR